MHLCACVTYSLHIHISTYISISVCVFVCVPHSLHLQHMGVEANLLLMLIASMFRSGRSTALTPALGGWLRRWFVGSFAYYPDSFNGLKNVSMKAMKP